MVKRDALQGSTTKTDAPGPRLLLHPGARRSRVQETVSRCQMRERYALRWRSCSACGGYQVSSHLVANTCTTCW
jgi:hypothetical protein